MAFICEANLKALYDRTKNKNYQDKIWEGFIKNSSKFIYKGWYEYQADHLCHTWEYGGYRILVWLLKNGKGLALSSVHTSGSRFNEESGEIIDAGECVLSHFNEYRSKQLASILLQELFAKKSYVYR